MKTNSNSYTIVYSAIIVIVVAFLLAFVSTSLKDIQDKNVALDKKKQILYSLNIRGLDNVEAEKTYKEVIVSDAVIDENAQIQAQGTQGGEDNGFKLGSTDAKEGRLALYICKVKGATKYVIPVYGMGLWGPISGYVAIDEDKNTVYGAYFNHDSETAGLGAEIKDNEGWQAKFQGKKLFKAGDNAIALSVNKKVEDPTTQVDAVSGATLTSDGVAAMLKECIGKYAKFLNNK
ncbi:MAG: NADH:ubiquinone reductase (Na(+)-transporting) subunit C [Prevotellaceae bacterium]|nr:NADH:ubiquinone reductase (Na(+)-transporting) subunit C [Prevotella sp.]MDD7258380.1 NADH:ubiquinone reductase (Na(+)-transporting) subunit C [Prevotellaceae bacterium]MDY6131163.1 NADH:ubiquinone reductase (Na(+)-transporting) subunit C [Prevotella sp.]